MYLNGGRSGMVHFLHFGAWKHLNDTILEQWGIFFFFLQCLALVYMASATLIT